jgi:hypothetical protein
MEKDTTSLRQKTIAVLTQRGEPMSYRELTDTLWSVYPEYRDHMVTKYDGEKKARSEQRIRLGILVKDNPGVFTATKSEGIVLVGLAASEADAVEEIDDEVAVEEGVASPAVYWYTFPAYRRPSGPYPIKIGRGNDPKARVGQQVTAMPEQPDILGTFEHDDTHNLERALHAILTLRGKRKNDAPGAEWFVTTPEEVAELIRIVIGSTVK